MDRLTVRVACGASLLTGLFFVFVWAPHPWGWVGFDQYYDLGRQLARGESFPTLDVPWGYAYFLATFYRLFGERLWVPLLVQVALNASMPLLVYRIARQLFDEPVALIAALLTGFVSFNTVYASTQSSDAICNVLFMVAVLVFIRALKVDGWRWYALAGVLFGLAPQFRPNLILIPLLLGGFVLVTATQKARAVLHAAVLVAVSGIMLTPWLARNYKLTGELLPTSTHGGVQLWYGSLQTGPYLHSRAHNPRSAFELPSQPYTSLDRVPLIVSGRLSPCNHGGSEGQRDTQPLTINYWTDRDATHRTLVVRPDHQGEFQGEIPVQPAPTTFYYQVDPGDGRVGPADVFFVSADHLGDMDAHGDLLDVFDVVRLMRHAAWHETVPHADRLDLDGDGMLSGADAAAAAHMLAASTDARRRNAPPPGFANDESTAALSFDDGSRMAVSKSWTGRITDVGVSGESADAVLHASLPLASLKGGNVEASAPCRARASIGINTVYYREQPHMMRRYFALAMDNIRRDPAAYGASVLYRAARVFFIEGSDDPHTTHQFSGGGRIYRAAFWVSGLLLALAGIGVWLGWRRRASVALPALLIAYIPATLAFVLTNMRYSITVQPLLFMFVAVTLVTVLERTGLWPRRGREDETAAPGRAGIQTAHRL